MKKLPVNRIFVALLVVLMSCSGDGYTPKPKGYPRMAFPPQEYRQFSADCPFAFEYLTYAKVTPSKSAEHPCWLNIDYPFLKSRIHLSYKEINGNLFEYIEDSRTLVYKHTIKASAIDEMNYIDTVDHVYAKVYELSGNAASSVQFYATDSTKHFLRGALYFNAKTNADSLQPAIRFIRDDVTRFITTLRWKDPF